MANLVAVFQVKPQAMTTSPNGISELSLSVAVANVAVKVAAERVRSVRISSTGVLRLPPEVRRINVMGYDKQLEKKSPSGGAAV